MTLYERLGVEPGATRSQLRVAYRQRMRRAHPDAGGSGDPVAVRALSEAWAILGTPKRRDAYDRTIKRRSTPSPAAGRRVSPRPVPSRNIGRRDRLARLTIRVLAAVFAFNVIVLVLTVTR